MRRKTKETESKRKPKQNPLAKPVSNLLPTFDLRPCTLAVVRSMCEQFPRPEVVWRSGTQAFTYERRLYVLRREL
jgi:hypothetical protein